MREVRSRIRVAAECSVPSTPYEVSVTRGQSRGSSLLVLSTRGAHLPRPLLLCRLQFLRAEHEGRPRTAATGRTLEANHAIDIASRCLTEISSQDQRHHESRSSASMHAGSDGNQGV